MVVGMNYYYINITNNTTAVGLTRVSDGSICKAANTSGFTCLHSELKPSKFEHLFNYSLTNYILFLIFNN